MKININVYIIIEKVNLFRQLSKIWLLDRRLDNAIVHSLLLVDTGATLSVLSSRVYVTIKSKLRLFHIDQVV